MQWIEVSVPTRSDEIDDVCAQLAELGAGGMVVEDEADFQDFLEHNHQYWDYVDDALEAQFRGVSRIKFYLSDDDDGRAQLETIRAGIGRGLTTATVRDSDWENNWRQYYQPIAVGEKLVVVPEWLEAPADGRIALRLDPGLIFGTGSHPTTRMCLAALEQYAGAGKTVLDLGCGTGLELDALYNLRTDISVIGIDLSPDMLDALMKKHGDKDLTLLCGSYFAVPFPGAFDAVISFESLHHFLPEKKRRLFKRIYDCLTPGGMFVNGDYFACCDEEENLLRETWSRKRREENIPDDTFVHFDIPLTKEHEAELLKKVGFTVTVENGNDCLIIKAVK